MTNKNKRYFLRNLKHRFLVSSNKFRKLRKNQIFFIGYSGLYHCNLKAIAEELLREKIDANIYWSVYKDTDQTMFPKEINVVTHGSKAFYKALSTSEVIIDNDITLANAIYKKKKGQTLIETWHGSIGIKKFGWEANDDVRWFKFAEKEAKMTDYLVSNSEFENEVYRSTFWKNTPIWLFGHPRNDSLFIKDEKLLNSSKEKFCKKNKINVTNKLCLYAPTFRDNDNSPLIIDDYEMVKNALEQKFGGNWSILIKFHHNTKDFIQNKNLPDSVIDVSSHPDVHDLLPIIDCGITDYSSWICEFALTRKPAFIYATDIKNYTEKERKLFLGLDKLPFSVSNNLQELFRNISNFDALVYTNKCDKFFKDYGSVDDGHASERVVEQIKKILNSNQG